MKKIKDRVWSVYSENIQVKAESCKKYEEVHLFSDKYKDYRLIKNVVLIFQKMNLQIYFSPLILHWDVHILWILFI